MKNPTYILDLKYAKCLSIVLILLFGISSPQGIARTNYYISSSDGNNNRTILEAQNPATAWGSIDILNANFAAIQPGDSILFKRGDIFFGTLNITKSGTSTNPIVIGAYGTGNKPIISGFSTISTWTSLGNSIYEADVPNSKASIKCVLLNGNVQAVGRYPKLNASNGGYLTFESHVDNTQITDNELTDTPNWTGGEIAIRKNHWIINSTVITSHVGNTLIFESDGSTYYPIVNLNGYFIQNHLSTLTENGDWCYDKVNKKIKMYLSSSPTDQQIKVATIDNLLSINSFNYIKIKDISFQGANTKAIYGNYVNTLSIENCDLKMSGECSIDLNQIYGDLQLNNNTISNSLNNAVRITSSATNAGYCTLLNNTIQNTGMFPGMGMNGDEMYNALEISAPKGALIQYNTIQNSGYLGLNFSGNDILIKNNVIDTYCINKDDGAGIYTWNGGVPMKIWTNRIISENIVCNGIGNVYGLAVGAINSAYGIYMDNNTNHVDILNNTIYNINGSYACHNNSPSDIKIKGNTCYNIQGCFDLNRYANDGSDAINGGNDIYNVDIQNNYFFSVLPTQKACNFNDRGLNFPTTRTLSESMKSVGTIDNNYYHLPNKLGFSYSYRNDKNSPYIYSQIMSCDAWKLLSGYETNGTFLEPIPAYQINSLVSANLYSNSKFNSNISGVSSYSAPLIHSLSWDNTNKIDQGTLKVSITAAPSSRSNFAYFYAPIGAVSKDKTYILRFSTISNIENCVVGANLRQTLSPWSGLAAVQYAPYSTTRKEHEFLIKPLTSTDFASWEISVYQSVIGYTYIDNVEVYEVNAIPITINDCARFEVNVTNSSKKIDLNSEYVSMDGIPYSGSLTLQPYSSKILILKNYYKLSTALSSIINGNTTLNWYISDNFIFIKSTDLIVGRSYKVMIVDVLGKTVYANNVPAENGFLKINASDFSRGIYLVQLTTD
ncbi:MAG: hypothetical protein WCG08_08000, partial [Paludibacter sp.]